MPDIHPSAIVDPKAEIAENVKIGPFSIVKANVVIEDGTDIHSHVLVDDGARIGKNCIIHHGAVISSRPQDLKYKNEKTTLEIGENTEIREYCDLNRGTDDKWKTTIGKNCFFMAYTHAAHDCIVGDNVILANGVQLAGHVTIEDWVIVGGLVAIHQFSLVGQHALIGGGFRVTQDVPPYIIAAGVPLAFKGLNKIGLGRRGFSEDTIASLRKCYRILYQSKLKLVEAKARIQEELGDINEVQNVLQFLENSKRSIIRLSR